MTEPNYRDYPVQKNLARSAITNSPEELFGRFLIHHPHFEAHWAPQRSMALPRKQVIPDFVAPFFLLIVEGDDPLHWEWERIEEDFYRDYYFAEQSYRTLCVTNAQVKNDRELDSICAGIKKLFDIRLGLARAGKLRKPEPALNVGQLVARAADLQTLDLVLLYEKTRVVFGVLSMTDKCVKEWIKQLQRLLMDRKAWPIQ